MAKTDKIEIRVTDEQKDAMRKCALTAGYGEREFSLWVRRVLQGEELHPNYTETAPDRRTRIR